MQSCGSLGWKIKIREIKDLEFGALKTANIEHYPIFFRLYEKWTTELKNKIKSNRCSARLLVTPPGCLAAGPTSQWQLHHELAQWRRRDLEMTSREGWMYSCCSCPTSANQTWVMQERLSMWSVSFCQMLLPREPRDWRRDDKGPSIRQNAPFAFQRPAWFHSWFPREFQSELSKPHCRDGCLNPRLLVVALTTGQFPLYDARTTTN